MNLYSFGLSPVAAGANMTDWIVTPEGDTRWNNGSKQRRRLRVDDTGAYFTYSVIPQRNTREPFTGEIPA